MMVVVLNFNQIVCILMVYVASILITWMVTGAHYYLAGRRDERDNIIYIRGHCNDEP